MAQRDRPKVTDPTVDGSAEDTATVLTEPVADETPISITPQMDLPTPLPDRPQPNGFLPALGGGMLAAVIGFGLSHFDVFGLRPAPADTSALDARLSGVEDGLTRIDGDLSQLASAPQADTSGLSERIAALENAGTATASGPGLEEVAARMTALEAQLADAAATGTGAPGAALAALQAEVRALKSAPSVTTEDVSALVADTQTALSEAKALAASTQAMADSARASAALGQLRAALDTGQPYTAALAMLQGSEIPAALSDHATTGLPTLATLQDRFPAAARAALDAALRANPGESWTDRVGTFLRSQTGARSVTPREGSDPDSVLSRAEAALETGDLETALQEMSALPEEARAAMADWLGLAEQRRAAAAAVGTLADKLGG